MLLRERHELFSDGLELVAHDERIVIDLLEMERRDTVLLQPLDRRVVDRRPFGQQRLPGVELLHAHRQWHIDSLVGREPTERTDLVDDVFQRLSLFTVAGRGADLRIDRARQPLPHGGILENVEYEDDAVRVGEMPRRLVRGLAMVVFVRIESFSSVVVEDKVCVGDPLAGRDARMIRRRHETEHEWLGQQHLHAVERDGRGVMILARLLKERVGIARSTKQRFLELLQRSGLLAVAIGERELELLRHLKAKLVEHRREKICLAGERGSADREEERPSSQQFVGHLQVAPRAGPVGHLQAVRVADDACAVGGHLVGAKPLESVGIANDRVAPQLVVLRDVPRFVVVELVPTVRADDLLVGQLGQSWAAHARAPSAVAGRHTPL